MMSGTPKIQAHARDYWVDFEYNSTVLDSKTKKPYSGEIIHFTCQSIKIVFQPFLQTG